MRDDGFSEQQLLGLEELERRVMAAPPEVLEDAAREVPAGNEPHFRGHRARLRKRFEEAGAKALADYEMIELILFNAIPRVDVKPLAKHLIEEFGDFNHAISAPPRRLREVAATFAGVSTYGTGPRRACSSMTQVEAVVRELKIVEAAAHRLARARVIDRPALSSWTALMEYCKTAMAHRDTEQFRILFLDRKNVLIADEAQGSGTVDHVPVYPREVVRRALELNASALILAHNHPSGDPTPSEADIEMTDQIRRAADAVGVTIHDHVVIGKTKDASFRQLGLM